MRLFEYFVAGPVVPDSGSRQEFGLVLANVVTSRAVNRFSSPSCREIPGQNLARCDVSWHWKFEIAIKWGAAVSLP